MSVFFFSSRRRHTRSLCDWSSDVCSSDLARIRNAELRPLGASFAQRVPGYENVPAIAETYPGFELVGWFLMVAPAGTPSQIVQRVNREMDRILKDPETAQRLRGLGFFTEGAETPEAVGEAIRADREKWGRIVKEIGIQPE